MAGPCGKKLVRMGVLVFRLPQIEVPKPIITPRKQGRWECQGPVVVKNRMEFGWVGSNQELLSLTLDNNILIRWYRGILRSRIDGLFGEGFWGFIRSPEGEVDISHVCMELMSCCQACAL